MKSDLLPKTTLMVSWPGLLLVLVLIAVVAAATGAATTYWVIKRYTLRLPLQAQRLNVVLPDQLPVDVEILPQDPSGTNPDETTLRNFPVSINDNFKTVVHVDTRIPIKMDVPFRGEVPVDIMLPLKTTVRTRVLGINMELPVEGEIPLKFKLPVNLSIPIDQTLPMKFNLPVNTHIEQQVNVRVQSQQAARIRLHEPSLEVTLQGGEISVPLSWLSLSAPADDGGMRQLGPLVQPPDENKLVPQ